MQGWGSGVGQKTGSGALHLKRMEVFKVYWINILDHFKCILFCLHIFDRFVLWKKIRLSQRIKQKKHDFVMDRRAGRACDRVLWNKNKYPLRSRFCFIKNYKLLPNIEWIRSKRIIPILSKNKNHNNLENKIDQIFLM